MHTRKFRIFLLSMTTGAAIVAAACSASDSSPALDAQQDPSTPRLASSDASLADSSRSTAPPPSEGGAVADAGVPTLLDGGDMYEGGVPCIVGGVLEEESNDTADLANTLNPTVCGAVLPGTESDFLKFRLKPSTTSYSLEFEGNVSVTLRVDGDAGTQTVTITPTSFPALPSISADKDYSLEVKSMNGQRQNWRVTLDEK